MQNHNPANKDDHFTRGEAPFIFGRLGEDFTRTPTFT